MNRRSRFAVAAFFGTSALLLAQAAETPLARLRVDEKKVGWDGVDLGMSVVQVERRVGLTLPLTQVHSVECGSFRVDVERDTLRLTVGFPSARPGAKLDYLYVHFEGYQVLAKRDDLVAELKRIVPGAAYFAPAKSPDLAEAQATDPTYSLPGESGFGVRVEPGAGLLLTRRNCLG